MFEGGIRVPAIIRYPKEIPANEVREQLAMETDWFSTVADLANIDITGLKVDGKSLMPIIKNAKDDSQHETVYWQLGGYDDTTAQWVVRKGPWKLIGNVNEPLGEMKQKQMPELFLVNLDEDIGEQNNLAETNPQKLNELLQLHDVWLKSVRDEMNK
tara:strand:- start:5765 stop:6235 length:471 start_codon:yes stop_codon:yes gene_type:complete